MATHAPHISDVPLSRPVSASPGGVAFPLGSGRGQFAVLLAVVCVTVVAWALGARAALLALAAVCGLVGALRLVLPPRWVPALVNRGRWFDVAASWGWALAILVILATGVDQL